jgi:hypothetical protein
MMNIEKTNMHTLDAPDIPMVLCSTGVQEWYALRSEILPKCITSPVHIQSPDQHLRQIAIPKDTGPFTNKIFNLYFLTEYPDTIPIDNMYARSGTVQRPFIHHPAA